MMRTRFSLEALTGGWREFWFASIPPHVYALLRIALGLSGCAILLTRADFSAFWDLSGFVPLETGRAVELKQWLVDNGLSRVAGLFALGFAASSFVLMTVGLWTRYVVPMAFGAALLMQAWNYLPMTGADGALRGFLFCLLWADSAAVWSIDSWRRRFEPRTTPAATSVAPLRLLRFQLAIIYLSAGLYKIDSPIWRNGTAVYYVLNSNVHQRIPYFISPDYEVISTLLTYATLLWELGFAFMILFRPARLLAVLLGIGIHVGMYSFMEVGPFHLVMLSGYIAFLDPQRVSEWFRRSQSASIPVSTAHNPVRQPSNQTT